MVNKKIIIIGPGGAGKSELSFKLGEITNLPVYHLDNIWWNKDRTHISKEEFDIKLNEILNKDEWIIDGDYSRTYETRIKHADLVIYLDFQLEVCLDGVESRLGKVRKDIPFIDYEFDPEFKDWIYNWFSDKRPHLLELLERYKGDKEIIILHDRKEIDQLIVDARWSK